MEHDTYCLTSGGDRSIVNGDEQEVIERRVADVPRTVVGTQEGEIHGLPYRM